MWKPNETFREFEDRLVAESKPDFARYFSFVTVSVTIVALSSERTIAFRLCPPFSPASIVPWGMSIVVFISQPRAFILSL